jgi:hypothetical protein
MLLHRLVASMSAGATGPMTQSSALTSSATTSQSSTSGPPSAPLGTCPWYLDFGASFHMTPHSAHISSMRPSYRHLTIQTVDGLPLSIVGQCTLCSNSLCS